MGLPTPVAEVIIAEHCYRKIEGDILLIGRQSVFLNENSLIRLLAKYGLVLPVGFVIEYDSSTQDSAGALAPRLISDRCFLRALGIENINFLDQSAYQDANIIHDLGYPVPDNLVDRFDFIYNGSCLDNMFGPGVAMENLSKMLRVGGRVINLEHATSFNGPYLMFSPGWFWDYYVTNSFADCKVYLGSFYKGNDLSYGPWEWYFVNLKGSKCNYQEKKGYTPAPRANNHFMIVCIAEKGITSTSDRQPIQAQYRFEEANLREFDTNAESIGTSRRPVIMGRNGEKYEHYLTQLGSIGDETLMPMSAVKAKEAFVLRPNASTPQWPAIVLAYIRAFTARAPVALVVVNDAAHPGDLDLAKVMETLAAMILESGKAAFADIEVTETLELATTLGQFTQVHMLPFGPDSVLTPSLEFTLFRAALAGSIGRRLGQAVASNNRLLTILDYATQPYSLGDFLLYLMGSMMAAESAGIEKVDLCILSDLSRGHADPVMRGWVTAENQHDRLMSILPLIELHPRFGSLFVFDSITELNAYLGTAGRGYQLWPSYSVLQEQKYLYYDILKMIKVFHERLGRIPQFKFGSPLETWVREFFQQNARGFVPVTVNLRNNPSFGSNRNYVLSAWRDFFARCEGRIPVKFIITCAASEVDPTLRNLPNVVFAKDHHTTVLQDLALIRFAAFHLGSSSGPATIPLLGTEPYFIFNCDSLPYIALYDGSLMQNADGELYFSFAHKLQAFGTVPETAESIWLQFDKIWTSRDWAGAWSMV